MRPIPFLPSCLDCCKALSLPRPHLHPMEEDFRQEEAEEDSRQEEAEEDFQTEEMWSSLDLMTAEKEETTLLGKSRHRLTLKWTLLRMKETPGRPILQENQWKWTKCRALNGITAT